MTPVDLLKATLNALELTPSVNAEMRIDIIEVLRFVIGKLESTDGRGPYDTVRESMIMAQSLRCRPTAY